MSKVEFENLSVDQTNIEVYSCTPVTDGSINISYQQAIQKIQQGDLVLIAYSVYSVDGTEFLYPYQYDDATFEIDFLGCTGTYGFRSSAADSNLTLLEEK